MSQRTGGSWIRSLTILASGSFLAQVITLVASPIMTRLYSVSEIGQYTLILTVVGLFGGAVCGRYDMAIVSEEDDDNVLPLIALCMLCTGLMSTVIALGSMLYDHAKGYPIAQILANAFFVFVLLLLNGVSNILISYNNRCREYGVMTSVHLTRALAKQFAVICGGLVSPHAGTLVFSEAIGTIFGVKKQSGTLKARTDGFAEFHGVKKSQVLDVACKHKKQALFATPALLASSFSYSSISFFINSLYGDAALGLYSLSYRLLGLPLNIICSSVSRVYLEEASRHYQETASYRKAFMRTSGLLLAMAIPMTALLFVLAPRLCATLFGEEYDASGVYLRYLAPMFGIRLIVSPLSVGMQISQKQDDELLLQILFVAASIASFIFAKLNAMRVESYLLVVSVAYSLIYMGFYAFLFAITQKDGGRING